MPIKKNVNRKFFKTWNREMAYILGFLFADGNVVRNKRGAHYVSFYSSDKNLLDNIRKVMSSNHVVARRSVRSGLVYRIQIGSQEIAEDLRKLGFVQKKSKRMRVPKIPILYFGDFLRGYFDGDGNVWVGYGNLRRSKPTRVMCVAFTSASAMFLKNLIDLLRQPLFDIKGGSIYLVKGKNCSRLSFSTSDSLKLYKVMYNTSCRLFLRRKKIVFDTFIEMRA